MKIKTKFLIALGTPVAAITPVVAVVSCGSSNMSAEQIGRTDAEVAAYQKELKEWKQDWANYEWSEHAIVNTHVDEGIFQNQDLTKFKSVSGKDFWLPSFIDAIGANAFNGADLPKTFNLKQTPNGKEMKLLKIGNQAFMNCDLSAFTDFLPKSVFSIGDHAFDGAKLPDDFKIGQSIIDMGWGILANTTLPTNFEFNPKLSIIPRDTFSSATFQNSFKVGEQFSSIDSGAFYKVKFDRYNLDFWKDATGKHRLQMIYSGAFSGTLFNYEFELPESVTTLDSGAFTQTNFPHGFKFATGTRLKTIPALAFSGAEIVDKFDWNGVTPETIGTSAFESAKLPNNFTLAPSVKLISEKAFAGVKTPLPTTLLTALGASLEKLGVNVFQGTVLPENFALPDKTTKLTAQMIGEAVKTAELPSGCVWRVGPKLDQDGLDKDGLPMPLAVVTRISAAVASKV